MSARPAIALCAALLATVASAQKLSVTAREVAETLGLDEEQIAAVEAGEPVMTDLEAVTETELGLTFSVISSAEADLLYERLDKGIGVGDDPAVLDHGPIGDDPAASLAKLTLPAEEIDLLADAAPGDDLNLAEDEIQRLQAAGKGKSGDAKRSALMEAYRAILVERFVAYKEKGLEGIKPYARGDGEFSNPGDEIAKGLTEFHEMGSLLPTTYKALRDYPDATIPGLQHRFWWILLDANGRAAPMLAHESFARVPAGVLSTEKRFYVGHTLNSMVMISGALPKEGGGCVIFYANRTFTEQVAGFMGGAARGIGRQIMRGEIDELYKAYQEHVEKTPAS